MPRPRNDSFSSSLLNIMRKKNKTQATEPQAQQKREGGDLEDFAERLTNGFSSDSTSSHQTIEAFTAPPCRTKYNSYSAPPPSHFRPASPHEVLMKENSESEFLSASFDIFQSSTTIQKMASSILNSVLEYTQGTELFFIRSNVNRFVLDGALSPEKVWTVLQGIRLSTIKLFSHQIFLDCKCSEKPVLLKSEQEVKLAGSDHYVYSAPAAILCIPIILQQKFLGAVYVSSHADSEVFSSVNTKLISLTMSNLIGVINQSTLEDCVKKTSVSNRRLSSCTIACQRTGNIIQDTMLAFDAQTDEWSPRFVAVNEEAILSFASPFDISPVHSIMIRHLEMVKTSAECGKKENAEFEMPSVLPKAKKKQSMLLIKARGDFFYFSIDSLRVVQVWRDLLSPKCSENKIFELSSLDLPLNIRIDPETIKEDKIIGQGGAASVRKGKWNETPVAVKRFYNIIDQSQINSFFGEIELLNSMRHPNIVLLMGGFVVEGVPSIVCELAERGSLDNVLYDPLVNLDSSIKLSFMKGIARALQYLHSMNPPVIHRDVKPQNILVTENWNVKLADFGLARVCNEPLTSGQGTVKWMAPEQLCNNPYTIKADIYSFALTMWEIIEQTQFFVDIPFQAQIEIQVVNNKLRPPFSDKFSPAFRELISQCWDSDPSRRPSATNVLNSLSTFTESEFQGTRENK